MTIKTITTFLLKSFIIKLMLYLFYFHLPTANQ
nr:MAG TPA: hypothetical protein [Bacteriophage sp.]